MASKRRYTCVLLILLVSATLSLSAATTSDSDMQAKIAGELQKKTQFNNVQSKVENGTVTLTGTVRTCQQKVDLEKESRQARQESQAERSGDGEHGNGARSLSCRRNCSRRLTDNRIGYDCNVFDYLTANVRDGVATDRRARCDLPGRQAGSRSRAVNDTEGVKGRSRRDQGLAGLVQRRPDSRSANCAPSTATRYSAAMARIPNGADSHRRRRRARDAVRLGAVHHGSHHRGNWRKPGVWRVQREEQSGCRQRLAAVSSEKLEAQPSASIVPFCFAWILRNCSERLAI